MRTVFARKQADTKKNLAVKVLWKIIHQIKGFTLLIQIISFNFADIKQTTGLLAERPDINGFATRVTFQSTRRRETAIGSLIAAEGPSLEVHRGWVKFRRKPHPVYF
jgi:hypothetical protein